MSPADFKAARDTLGMSTTELAEWLGLEMPNGRTMIREMESGKRSISGPIRRALTLALDVRKPEQTNRLDTNNVVERLRPVAWRYRYLHPGRVNHWIVRQSPAVSSEASSGYVAVEAEPLYSAATIQSLSDRIDVLEGLVEESLFHLRLDEAAKAYHERALASLTQGGK